MVASKQDDGLWEQRFAETVVWLREHPHGESPPRHGKYAALGYWWSTQRRMWSNKTLQQTRKQRLVEAGFPFEQEVTSKQVEAYAKRLAQARRYLKEHGNLDIPLRIGGVYDGLGKWAQKARLGTHPAWVLEQLQEDMPRLLVRCDYWPRVHAGARDRAWDAHYQRLLGFIKRFGHSSVPRDWPEDHSLAIWVYKQRVRCRDGRMTPREYRLLKRCGFVFDPCPGVDPLRRVS
jgi:hypothetical protein